MKNLQAVQYFYVNDGRVWKSLEDFFNEINSISDETFEFHLNKEKNDFYNWIYFVIEDKELAKAIQKVKSRSGLQKKLKDHSKASKKAA